MNGNFKYAPLLLYFMKADIGLWLINYFPWVYSIIPLLAFLSPIIGGGEFGVIGVAFLFINNIRTFFIITIFCYIGLVVNDSIWFFIARTNIFKKFRQWKKISKHYENMENKIDKLSHGRDILAISLAKLMIGTRVLLILYTGKKDIMFRNYLFYASIANSWLCIVFVLIGIIAASGFSSIIRIFKNIEIAITFLIVFFMIFYILQKWISRKLTAKQK